MADKYVNLELSGSGGLGTEIDPWKKDDFFVVMNGYSADDTIYIKGMAEYIFTTSPGNIYIKANPGNTVSLKPWLEDEPWRIFIGGESDEDGELILNFDNINIYGAVIEQSGIDTPQWGPECIFYNTNSFYNSALNTSAISDATIIGDTYFYGCLLNFFEITQLTDTYKTVFLQDSSLIGRIDGNSIPGNTAVANNCVFSDSTPFINFDSGVTLTDCQTGYAETPSMPAWDSPKDSWNYVTLYGSVEEPPQPGFGAPTNYPEYDTFLFGGARDGIGTGYVVPGVAPTITEQPENQTVIQGNTAEFSLTATGDPAPSYRWYKGDTPLSDGGDISGATTDTLSIANAEVADEDTYKCVVSNGIDPDATSNEVTLTVDISPVADFTATPVEGIVPLTVSFTDQSLNEPTSWLWDFGDLTTSTNQNPVHTYQKNKKYTVTLTASDAAGEDTKVVENFINVKAVYPGPKDQRPGANRITPPSFENLRAGNNSRSDAGGSSINNVNKGRGGIVSGEKKDTNI